MNIQVTRQMPKAHIKTTSGATILIEGSTEEVAELVQRIGSRSHVPTSGHEKKKPDLKKNKPTNRSSLPDLLVSLIDGGFFRKPQELSSIKTKLAEMGHVYPATTVAPALLRLVRKRHIRRIKQNNRWFYTG